MTTLTRQSDCAKHCQAIEDAITSFEVTVQQGFYTLGRVFQAAHLAGDWLHDELWETSTLPRTWVNWLKLRGWQIRIGDTVLKLEPRNVQLLEQYPVAVDAIKATDPTLPTPSSIFQLEPFKFTPAPNSEDIVQANLNHPQKDKHERPVVYDANQPEFVELWRTAFELNQGKLYDPNTGGYKPPSSSQSRKVVKDYKAAQTEVVLPTVIDVTPPTTSKPEANYTYTPPPTYRPKTLKQIKAEQLQDAQRKKEQEHAKEQERRLQETKDYFLIMRDLAESARKLKSFLVDKHKYQGTAWLEDIRQRDAGMYSMDSDMTQFAVVMSDLRDCAESYQAYYPTPEPKTVEVTPEPPTPTPNTKEQLEAILNHVARYELPLKYDMAAIHEPHPPGLLKMLSQVRKGTISPADAQAVIEDFQKNW